MKTTTIFGIALLLMTKILAQTVTTFAEGTPDDGIALDADGNIYASNFTGDSVFKYAPDGTVSTFINVFDTPNGIGFDSQERLYVCDWNDNKLYRFTNLGDLDGELTIPGNPSGMIKVIDNDDMIYTRYGANTINRITSDFEITEISSDPMLNGPVGLAYDDMENLYVGNYNDRKIFRVRSDGSLAYVATVGNASNLGFIAYGQGYLWGTVLGEHKIYKINPMGIDDVMIFAGSIAGGADGDIAEATFNQPNGITFNDAEDTMYITDFGSKNLRVISGIALSSNDHNINASNLQVVTKPESQKISVQFKNTHDEKYTLEILNATGQVVYNEKKIITKGNLISEISTQSWVTGMYVVKVQVGQKYLTKRILLE